jgi:hypothetical protein
MTESMIERVSEAIRKGVCKHCRRACVGPGEGVTPDCDRTDCEWEPGTRLEKAHAAIEAMREPTDLMIDSACAARIPLYPAFEGQKPQPTAGEVIIAEYRAMIDAALTWPAGSADRAGVPLARD